MVNRRRMRRLLAVAAVVTTTAGLVALDRAVGHPSARATVRAGSPLPALRGWRDDGTVWRAAARMAQRPLGGTSETNAGSPGSTGSARGKRPLAILYVSATCPHCHAELARWRNALLAHPELASRIEVVVITAGPDRVTSLPSLGSHVADPGAQIAHSLGVNVVPLTLIIDTAGVVRSVSTGESDLASITLRLSQASGVDHAP